MWDPSAAMKELVYELVAQPSVVGSGDELAMAELIHRKLQAFPYFQAHPDQLWLQVLPGQPQRANVLALLKGEKAEARTLLLMGHLDTVGIEDYGPLQPYARDPEELKERLAAFVPPAEAEDLRSGKYIAGRGVNDMKTGVAAHMLCLSYFAEHPQELSGNLLFLAACDEEDNSSGILAALPKIREIKERHGLRMQGAINTDTTMPRYAGDPHRYLYAGTVGKLLPAFYCVGQSSHVGEPFSSLDPNLLTAALMQRISYNPEFSDAGLGELSLPPVSLKQTDFKPRYDVQTCQSALVYFNLALHTWSPQTVLAKLKQVAQECFRETLELIRQRQHVYCQQAGYPLPQERWQPKVLSYQELYREVLELRGQAFAAEFHRRAEELKQEKTELREYSIALIQELWQAHPHPTPAIIVFFASVYYPRQILDRERPLDAVLYEALQRAAATCAELLREVQLEQRFFYPYISDASFIGISDTEEEFAAYSANFPAFGRLHHLDTALLQELSMPVINIGPYGFDAHQMTERLDVEYSMRTVPNLIRETILEALK